METHSILECHNCGAIKIIDNSLELSSKEAACGCDKENIILYGLMQDKKFEFKKCEL